MKRILAAVTLFTRIPAWRWAQLPQSAYNSAVVYWPLTGWITGGATATAIYLSGMVLPPAAAVSIAFAIRLLLTGGLHEDGLADFADGFGGGHDKARILAIMKDSHIGTYGVITLICYFITAVELLASVPCELSAMMVFAADPMAKACASQITNALAYARPEGAKNKVTYTRMSACEIAANLIFGILPFACLCAQMPRLAFAAIAPAAALIALMHMMRKRIGGYTGDCCGAAYLICEITLLTAMIAIARA